MVSTKEQAREDFREYAKYADCSCCFPYWDYDNVSILDIWEWWDEDTD